MRLRRLKIANMSDVVTSDSSCRCVSSYCAYSYKKYLLLTKGVHVLLFVRNAWLCGCAKVSAQPENRSFHGWSANSSCRSQARKRERRGRALDATTNIAQALKLPSFLPTTPNPHPTHHQYRERRTIATNLLSCLKKPRDPLAHNIEPADMPPVRTYYHPSSLSTNTH